MGEDDRLTWPNLLTPRSEKRKMAIRSGDPLPPSREKGNSGGLKSRPSAIEKKRSAASSNWDPVSLKRAACQEKRPYPLTELRNKPWLRPSVIALDGLARFNKASASNQVGTCEQIEARNLAEKIPRGPAGTQLLAFFLERQHTVRYVRMPVLTSPQPHLHILHLTVDAYFKTKCESINVVS
ncbi:hypothetical protein JTE90_020486 [Oedothorax gibbosus]|uniref:Uncharacterized protein n=1 Tax=Oedothorax gibbosus TaxID=931172 RepID=A0AAV6USU6_9ARAC|nr:hypothetical protein JTE90_020486 [Oedothorax gibbosus]